MGFHTRKDYRADGLERHIDQFDIEAEREGRCMGCKGNGKKAQRRYDIAKGIKKCSIDDRQWKRLVTKHIKEEEENKGSIVSPMPCKGLNDFLKAFV